MRTITLSLVSFFLLHNAYGQGLDISKREFEKSLYSPITVSRSGLDDEHFKALTERQKKDLLSAKELVGQFFTDLQQINGTDPTQYLVPDLRKKYKSRLSLARALIAEETEVHSIGVLDFQADRNKRIQMKFYIVLFSEGTWVINELQVTLEQLLTGWKISKAGDIG